MQCQPQRFRCSKNVVVYRSSPLKTDANGTSLLRCNCLRNIVKSKIFKTSQKSGQVCVDSGAVAGAGGEFVVSACAEACSGGKFENGTAEGREARSPGGICHYIRRRSAPALGRGEKRRIPIPLPRTAIAGNRDGGGVCGMAAPQHSGGLGISGSTGNDHGAEVYFALSRKAVQFRVSSMPRAGRPGGLWKLLKPEEIGVQLTEGFIRSNKQADATITG